MSAPAPRVPPFVVYTDLDGSLLDHDSYDWHPAGPMLARLERADVPVVPVTSKTGPEVAALRHELGNGHPYVVENGAVTYVPDGYFRAGGLSVVGPSQPVVAVHAGPRRAQLGRCIVALRDRGAYRFRTFGELGEEGIVEHTGLSRSAARLANAREGSEPLLWEDSEKQLERFRAALAAQGLGCVRGGRFVHVLGSADKAAAVRALHAHYEAAAGSRLERVVLGDGPNDLAMLAEADVAVVIRGVHDHPMAVAGTGQTLRPEATGPAGWAQAMAQVLAARGIAWRAAAPTGNDGGG